MGNYSKLGQPSTMKRGYSQNGFVPVPGMYWVLVLGYFLGTVKYISHMYPL